MICEDVIFHITSPSYLHCSAGRDYDLVLHDDISMDKVFTGEPHKLHSYKEQKK